MSGPLHIDLVSDLACPWCFIAKRHLDVALRDLTGPVTVRWHPFFLNPDAPEAGEPYRAFLERKFGGADRVDALLARVAAAGREAGIVFAFERITHRANTLRAHRLLHRWQAQGDDASPLADALFSAHFLEGRDLGDPATLARIAAACGAPEAATEEYLRGEADRAAVIAAEARIRTLGVQGVPLFLLPRGRMLAGAQPPEALRAALTAA